MEKLFEEKKAITLIALIITIIVLLILAGVAITQLTNNGLFNNTKIAKEKHENAQNDENDKIAGYENEIDVYNGKNQGTDNSHPKMKMNSNLKDTLKQANMTVTLEDMVNMPAVINNTDIVPIITSSDVTKTSTSPITYIVSNNRGIIRTTSELNGEPAYNAFDNNNSTYLASNDYAFNGYYLEYEFPEEVYLFKTRYMCQNCSGSTSTAYFKIQGYNEEKANIQGQDPWEDISNNLTWSGNANTKREDTAILDYTKSYKKYRVYCTNVTGDGNHGMVIGFYSVQFDGILASDVTTKTEENIKIAILEKANIDELTLEQVLTNSSFAARLIDNLPIETIVNNETLLNAAKKRELIQRISSSDVTRSVVNGVITYTTNNKGTIRAPSEYLDGSWGYSWNAFDYSSGYCSYSAYGQANNYYLEYEFTDPVYALKFTYQMTDGTSAYGTRTFVIQGTNDTGTTVTWHDVSNDTTWYDDSNVHDVNLDGTTAYKRYRLYVKSCGSNTYYTGLVKFQLHGKK